MLVGDKVMLRQEGQGFTHDLEFLGQWEVGTGIARVLETRCGCVMCCLQRQ